MFRDKIQYTAQATVGGAGAGLAACGFLSFFPITLSMPIVGTVSAATSLVLAAYAFLNVR